MAINTNFNIYEPEAWIATALGNEYPMRPVTSNSVTNVAGANIEGLVASRNKSVKITRATKPTGSPNAYTGTYSLRTPDASEEVLTINKHYYDGFSIDKVDQRFALPDLVAQHFVPTLHRLIDQIDDDVKAEMKKFDNLFADIGSTTTVMDDADIRFARQIMAERALRPDGNIMVIDPATENDLTGLDLFHQADQYGARNILLSGSMGRSFGFDFFHDSRGSSYTAASGLDAGDRVAGLTSEGATEVVIDDGSGGSAASTFSEGDAIYFGSANDPNDFYVVDSYDASASTGTITLKTPLRADVSDNATLNAVDVSGGDSEIFFYAPESIALVTAVMPYVDGAGAGVRRAAGFEPVNGINYTLTVEETKSGVDVLVEVLYGTHNFRKDLGGRYIRGTADKA